MQNRDCKPGMVQKCLALPACADANKCRFSSRAALEEYLDFFFAVQGGAPPEHLAGNIDGATLEAFASLHGVQLMRRQKKANGVTKVPPCTVMGLEKSGADKAALMSQICRVYSALQIIQSGIVDPILDNQVKLHDCASHDLFSGVQSLGASKTGCTLSPEFRGTSSSPQEFKPSCPQNNYNRASVGTAARSSERLPE